MISLPDESGRGIAALLLLLFGAIAAALFNPLSLAVEIEMAVPAVFAVWGSGLRYVQWERH
jgi:hypothetical protein